jgi:retron-type reverse transcriptase
MNNAITAKPLHERDAIMTNTIKSPLFDAVIDFDNIAKGYRETQRGARKFQKEAVIFDMCRERNLVHLWRDLKDEEYEVGKYIRFKVFEPKERNISAPHIRDKTVQFAVHRVLKEVYKPVFIKGSFACQEDKGNHRAVEHLQHNMRVCKWKHGGGWILKIDVKKFFYSIDRDILKRILQKKIKDEKFLRLLNKIIDSSPEGEKGIPLGNVTSQDMANIYLDKLDQYCVRFLKAKYYTRYMDDVCIVTPTKEQAQEYLEKIKTFLEERLGLETNQKTKIFPLEQGVNAYGFKIWTTHRLLRDKSKQAMKRRIKRMDEKQKAGEMTKKEVIQAVSSWLGYARWSCSFNLCKKIFAPYPYIKVEGEIYFGRISRNNQSRRTVQERSNPTTPH